MTARLGLRLLGAGGRWRIGGLVLTTVAVGFGTAVLLFALSFQPAFETRYANIAWRTTPGHLDLATASHGLLISQTPDHLLGRPLMRMDVAALSADAPLPPGLPRIPGAGEAFVSPALAQQLADLPADELAARIGRVVGLVDAVGLAAPDELYAVIGQTPGALRTSGARAVTSLDTAPTLPAPDFIIQVLVTLALVGVLGPVAVFVATATRLSAARREEQLAALRLAGATPGQVYQMAAVEALLITLCGALLGIVLFVVLRPLVSLIPLNGLTWFPDAVAPSPVPAAAVLLAVPILGTGLALVALRRMAISPLGVARRVSGGRPSSWRLAPLLCSLLAFGWALTISGWTGASSLMVIALAFLGIIVGLVVAGPWLTAIIGSLMARGGGPRRLLAGRRLADEPRSAFGSVAGVVMAVFVGSAFFAIAAYARTQVDGATLLLRPTTISVTVPPAGSVAAASVAATIEGIAGVQSVAVVRPGYLVDPNAVDAGGFTAWVAPCSAVLAALQVTGAGCGGAAIHLGAGTDLPTSFVRLQGYGPSDGAAAIEGPMRDLAGVTPNAAMAPFVPPGLASDVDTEGRIIGLLPQALIDPSVVPDATAAMQVDRVLIATNGDPVLIERVRTSFETALPTAIVVTGAEARSDAFETLDELGRVVSLGVIGVLLLAGCSLAVAVVGGLLDRRRPFALLRQSGVPVALLRHVVLIEAIAPLVVVAAISAVLGAAVMQLMIASVSRLPAPPPDGSIVVLFVVSLGVAIATVALVLPMVGTVTDAQETRFE